MSTQLRRTAVPAFDTPGVQDYALKRQMLARVRHFMHAHLSTLAASRQAEVQAEARQFSRVAEAIEEDLSRLDQVLKAQARRSAPVVRQ